LFISSMAERLASIFGTEKDKVNCPFYFKIGACRHGDRCSRVHNKPTISQTLLIHNMYQNPAAMAVAVDGQALEVDEKEAQQHYDEFYEDVFLELGNFGEIEEINVTSNLGDHLSGNLYVKYHREEDALTAITKLQGRFYAGRQIIGEFSPVTDFKEARCRQYDVGECSRGGYCNFLHLFKPSRELTRKLFREQRKKYDHHDDRSRSRSRSPRRKRSRSRSPGRRHDRGDRDYDRDGRNDRNSDRRDRDRDRERDRGSDGEKFRERERERDRERDKERENREKERERDREKEGRERERPNPNASNIEINQ